MQAIFDGDEEAAKAFRKSISEARFARYLKSANDNVILGIQIYYWNALLSQSMYLPLQTWEITLRNKLNQFLIWKYNAKWPYDARALRAFTKNDNKRLSDTKLRLGSSYPGAQVPTDAIVADLSAGFWVSLLTKSYDVPFVWRFTIRRVFPHEVALDRETASSICDRLLDLRNRVAHHEPVLDLDLPMLRTNMTRITEGMCSASHAYAQTACTFQAIWGARPAVTIAAPAKALVAGVEPT